MEEAKRATSRNTLHAEVRKGSLESCMGKKLTNVSDDLPH